MAAFGAVLNTYIFPFYVVISIVLLVPEIDSYIFIVKHVNFFLVVLEAKIEITHYITHVKLSVFVNIIKYGAILEAILLKGKNDYKLPSQSPSEKYIKKNTANATA